VGYTGACKLKSDHTEWYTGANVQMVCFKRFEFIISDADPPWWLENDVFYSVNGLQYHTTIY
jgi:hypothetical protein